MDGPSRRDLLRQAVAAGLVGPLLLGRGPVRAGDDASTEKGGQAASEPVALDRDHLARGLVALSEAHTRHWSRGHHGAAVIASAYFRHENLHDARATRAVQEQTEAFMRFRKGEFPPTDPGPGRADPQRIVEQLETHVDQLRSGGHDAIYAALALRALGDLPDYRTPKIVDGVCKLLAKFVATVPAEPVPPAADDDPSEAYEDARDVARTTLDALLLPWRHLEGVGTGVVVHWITHADALITLEALGHEAVARRGHAAHRRTLRRKADEADHAEPEGRIDWLSAPYWESDAPRRPQKGSWFFGHSFKLPYSLFRLLRRADTGTPKRAACLARASKLEVPFL